MTDKHEHVECIDMFGINRSDYPQQGLHFNIRRKRIVAEKLYTYIKASVKLQKCNYPIPVLVTKCTINILKENPTGNLKILN